jgi:hypothetical protein
MKIIISIIEKADDGGYSIYAKDDKIPVMGSGLTEDEAKEDYLQVLKEQAEYYKEKMGEYPDWFRNGYEIEYKYDVSAFFLSFPFINATEFAKNIGINPSLMRKYKNGLATASDKQKDIIQKKFDEIINKLEVVKF